MTKKRTGRGPLVDAILSNDPSRLEVDLSTGEDPNERDADGRSPLHHAVLAKRPAMVQMLLDAKADVNSQDRDGWSPLHFAARDHDLEIAGLLIRAGSIVDAADAYGNTPLFRAVFESRGRGEMIELLLRSGADKNRVNNRGVSPAKLADRIANFDVKRWLDS